MKQVYVKAFDIPDAWYRVVEAVMKYGIDQKLQAYDEYAKTVYNLLVQITHPHIRPISCEKAGYNDQMINEYFANYFFTGSETGHEHNYGSRLREPIDQFGLVADMLREFPYTRRAVMVIPRPEDLKSEFAPCVRELQFYCKPEPEQQFSDYSRVWTTVFMRSWDTHVAGNPDLGSFQLAAEMVAGMVDKETGPLTLFVTNAHIYKKSVEMIKSGVMYREEKKTFFEKIRDGQDA